MRKFPDPPPDRGELLTPAQVAAHPKLFNGMVDKKYVLMYVKQLGGKPIKVKLGHVKRAYYFEDVREWIAARKIA